MKADEDPVPNSPEEEPGVPNVGGRKLEFIVSEGAGANTEEPTPIAGGSSGAALTREKGEGPTPSPTDFTAD